MSTWRSCPYCGAELPVGKAWRSAFKWRGLLRRQIGLTCRECDYDVVLAARWVANLVSVLITLGGAVSLGMLANHIELARGVKFSAVENAMFFATGVGTLFWMIEVIPPFFLRARKPVVMEDVDIQE